VTSGLRSASPSTPELLQPVTALSLGGRRRRIEALLLPDETLHRYL
jgi:hypothetical protein